MLLTKMLDAGHVNFEPRFPDWQSAIHGGCKPLVADGTVEAGYADEIIACIEKYGPYIIIAPDIAMPHSQENVKGVHKTAISFMKRSPLMPMTVKKTRACSLPLPRKITNSIWKICQRSPPCWIMKP